MVICNSCFITTLLVISVLIPISTPILIEPSSCTKDSRCEVCNENDECESCELYYSKIGNTDLKICLDSCPISQYKTYDYHRIECNNCHPACSHGCQGPDPIVSLNGCNRCKYGIFNNDQKVCLNFESRNIPVCKTGYFLDKANEEESNWTDYICRECHSECLSCDSFGQYLVKNKCICKNYQVVDHKNDPTIFCSHICPSIIWIVVLIILFLIVLICVFTSLIIFFCKPEYNIEDSWFIKINLLYMLCTRLYKKKENYQQNMQAEQKIEKHNDEGAYLLPKDVKRWESFCILDLHIKFEEDPKSLIGHGYFGPVYKGRFSKDNDSVDVAVKVINKEKYFKDVHETSFIRAQLIHPHVHKILGVCQTNGHHLKIISPLRISNLNDYLRKSLNTKKIALWKQYAYSAQIASGMNFLGKSGITHKNLMARSILVRSPDHVEISSFGVNRDFITEETNACLEEWRWLAVECLKNYKMDVTEIIYTQHSDIWAYGVTIWEIFIYCGEQPYSNVKDGFVLEEFLASNRRLAKPLICDEISFGLVKNCWSSNPRGRPKFEELYEHFSDFATKLREGKDVAKTNGKFFLQPSIKTDRLNTTIEIPENLEIDENHRELETPSENETLNSSKSLRSKQSLSDSSVEMSDEKESLKHTEHTYINLKGPSSSSVATVLMPHMKKVLPSRENMAEINFSHKLQAIEGINLLKFQNRHYSFNSNDFKFLDQIFSGNGTFIEHHLHKPTKKEVVLKFLCLPNMDEGKDKEVDRTILENIKHELEIIKEWQYFPNIFNIYGFSIHAEYLLICTDYMDMLISDLAQRYHRHKGYFPEIFIGATAVSVLNALNHLNSKNIMHRDIKPQNILINKSGEIKLCDFGISKILENSMNSVGTLRYWPPEWCRLQKSTHETGHNDVWSLGITLMILILEDSTEVENEALQQMNENLTEYITNFMGQTKMSRLAEDFIKECLKPIQEVPCYGKLFQTNFYKHYANQTTAAKISKCFETDLPCFENYQYINKLRFPGDNTIYDFHLNDFNFGQNPSPNGNKRVTHIKTKKQLFFKFYTDYNKMINEIEILNFFNNHPNIVGFYGYGKAFLGYYLFIEPLGINLWDMSKLLNEWQWIFPEKIIRHAIAIIIRTLKDFYSQEFCNIIVLPENILLRNDGVVKLSNFVYAKKMAEVKSLNDLGISMNNENENYVMPPDLILNEENQVLFKKNKTFFLGIDLWCVGIAILKTTLVEQSELKLFQTRIKNWDRTKKTQTSSRNLKNNIFSIYSEITSFVKNSFASKYSQNFINFTTLCIENLKKQPSFEALVNSPFYQTSLKTFHQDQELLKLLLNGIKLTDMDYKWLDPTFLTDDAICRLGKNHPDGNLRTIIFDNCG